MLRGSRFRRIFRGVYIDCCVPESPLLRVMAALALHTRSAYASHTSAAKVYQLPVPHTPLEHVSVFRKQDRRSHPGVRSHVSPLGVTVVKYRGVRVSDAASTFIALASMLNLVELVVVGDAMVKMGLISVRACACARHNRTGPVMAGRAAWGPSQSRTGPVVAARTGRNPSQSRTGAVVAGRAGSGPVTIAHRCSCGWQAGT